MFFLFDYVVWDVFFVEFGFDLDDYFLGFGFGFGEVVLGVFDK